MDTTFLIRFLSANIPYAGELQSLGMALQGALSVQSGPNAKNELHWFHSFVWSVIVAFGGGWLGFIWMGLPSSMLANDVNMGCCIIAFFLVNYTRLCHNFGMTLLITSFAQMFRTMGIVRFVDACFNAFKENPSKYYPIPVFGPILYATLLGNMSAFVLKGFHGHFQNGIPWPVQNGFFCATFYHFYVNDATGPIGNMLRTLVPIVFVSDQNRKLFATCFISLFMQIMGMIQLPEFLGPTFTPFHYTSYITTTTAKTTTAPTKSSTAGPTATTTTPSNGTTVQPDATKSTAATTTKKKKKKNNANSTTDNDESNDKEKTS